MKVLVEGKFPGMNEIIATSKKHYILYSKMKAEFTELFQWQTKNLPKIRGGKAIIRLHWTFKNKRRDPDNVMAAQKFILDALVRNGVLIDDTLDYIHSLESTFNLGNQDSVEIEVIPYRPPLEATAVSSVQGLTETLPLKV